MEVFSFLFLLVMVIFFLNSFLSFVSCPKIQDKGSFDDVDEVFVSFVCFFGLSS